MHGGYDNRFAFLNGLKRPVVRLEGRLPQSHVNTLNQYFGLDGFMQNDNGIVFADKDNVGQRKEIPLLFGWFESGLSSVYFKWVGPYRKLSITAIELADFRIPLRFSVIKPDHVKSGKIADRSAAFDKL